MAEISEGEEEAESAAARHDTDAFAAVELALDSVVKVFTVSSGPNYFLPWQNKAQRESMGSGKLPIFSSLAPWRRRVCLDPRYCDRWLAENIIFDLTIGRVLNCCEIGLICRFNRRKRVSHMQICSVISYCVFLVV